MSEDTHRSILVIDDSSTIRKFISGELMAHGHRVIAADSMEQALLYKEQKEFSLIITDLVMPGMGGIEGIKVFRREDPDIGIIAMSGGSGNKDGGKLLSQARFVGADSLMVKPFSTEELLTNVKAHIMAFDIEASVAEQKKNRQKILVIDDSTTIQKVLLRMLSRGGYNAVCASSIEEALERIDIVRINLVITDIFMPGMGGIVGIQAIRKSWPEVKIVAMSGGMDGLGGGDVIEAAKKVGAEVGLQKPFDDEKLLTTISGVLAG